MNKLLEDILSNRFLLEEFMWYALVSIVACTICCKMQILITKRKKFLFHYLLAEYIFLVLCFTVICRKKGELFQFFPIPFYDYGHREYSAFLLEMLMNVFMFVPFGFLLSLCFRSWSWQYVALTGIIFSTIIESLQWTFKCGSCETNDLINNTLGAIAGFCLYKHIYARKEQHHIY